MRSKKRKAAQRDSIWQLEIPWLWPDRDGLLTLPPASTAPSSVLLLPRLQRSPRGEVVRASRLLRSQFFSSWLSSRNWGAGGFGAAKERLFEMWLSRRLENSAFNALGFEQVVRDGAADLALDVDEVIGLVIRLTRAGSIFKSDDGLITFSG